MLSCSQEIHRFVELEMVLIYNGKYIDYLSLTNATDINKILKLHYRGADKSLARSGRKQARKHVRDARDFNNIKTRAVIKFFSPLQGKAPKEIYTTLTNISLFPSWSG